MEFTHKWSCPPWAEHCRHFWFGGTLHAFHIGKWPWKSVRDKKAPDNQMESQSLAISIVPRFQYLMSHLVCFRLTSEWEISICFCQKVKKNVLSTEPLAERRCKQQLVNGKLLKKDKCFALPQMKWGTLGTGVARRVSPCSGEMWNVGR